MTVKKIEMRPEGSDYGDILYPKTSADMVVNEKNGRTVESDIQELGELADGIIDSLDIHMQDGNNPHGTSKAQVGLGNVTNDKQMPISGGQATGIMKAQANTSYTTAQIRNVIISPENPSGGQNGDLWFKYV